ncbi:MAG: hypothetical protein PHS75_07480 [Anaerolineaceae bacterium]|nr:hypothetical protein [Anaerolineaceae bacterium]
MENGNTDNFGLWTLRTVPPEHFPDLPVWNQFIDTYKSCGLKSEKFRDEKKRIEIILQDRYLSLRGKHTDEEANAKKDLTEWLTAYPWSHVVVYLRSNLLPAEKGVFGQDTPGAIGQDALQNAYFEIERYLESFDPKKGTLDAYLTWSVFSAMNATRRSGHQTCSEEEVNQAINYVRAVKKFEVGFDRQPIEGKDDKDLMKIAKIKKESTIKKWREAWENCKNTISLDSLSWDDGATDENPMEEYIQPVYEERSELDDQRLQWIEEIVENDFTKNEKAVYYGTMDGKPDKQIYNENVNIITKDSYVRKIRERYIEKLKKQILKKMKNEGRSWME